MDPSLHHSLPKAWFLCPLQVGTERAYAFATGKWAKMGKFNLGLFLLFMLTVSCTTTRAENPKRLFRQLHRYSKTEANLVGLQVDDKTLEAMKELALAGIEATWPLLNDPRFEKTFSVENAPDEEGVVLLKVTYGFKNSVSQTRQQFTYWDIYINVDEQNYPLSLNYLSCQNGYYDRSPDDISDDPTTIKILSKELRKKIVDFARPFFMHEMKKVLKESEIPEECILFAGACKEYFSEDGLEYQAQFCFNEILEDGSLYTLYEGTQIVRLDEKGTPIASVDENDIAMVQLDDMLAGIGMENSANAANQPDHWCGYQNVSNEFDCK